MQFEHVAPTKPLTSGPVAGQRIVRGLLGGLPPRFSGSDGEGTNAQLSVWPSRTRSARALSRNSTNVVKRRPKPVKGPVEFGTACRRVDSSAVGEASLSAQCLSVVRPDLFVPSRRVAPGSPSNVAQQWLPRPGGRIAPGGHICPLRQRFLARRIRGEGCAVRTSHL